MASCVTYASEFREQLITLNRSDNANDALRSAAIVEKQNVTGWWLKSRRSRRARGVRQRENVASWRCVFTACLRVHGEHSAVDRLSSPVIPPRCCLRLADRVCVSRERVSCAAASAPPSSGIHLRRTSRLVTTPCHI